MDEITTTAGGATETVYGPGEKFPVRVDGDGLAGDPGDRGYVIIEVLPGTRLSQILGHPSVKPGQPADSWLVRANRGPVDPDYVLTEGSRVTLTPKKVKGHARAAAAAHAGDFAGLAL